MVSTRYITEVASTSSSSASASTSSEPSGDANGEEQKSFFDSTGKVAGTFTAVGVVVVGALGTLLYCCCFGAGRRNDDYSDEENQYSSDELSVNGEKAAVAGGAQYHSKSSLRSSNLKRDNLSKSILSIFNPGSNGMAGSHVGRSMSKKKLNPNKEPAPDTGGPIMFPILEFDNRLDPLTMFQNSNASKFSFADENDYSRRILHVANPE